MAARNACSSALHGCTYGCASPAGTSAVATPRRCGTPGAMPTWWDTRSLRLWNPAQTGAGAMSTRTMSEVPTVTAAEPMAETPDRYGAYPRLTDDQIAALEAGGTRRSSAAGETLVHEGRRTDEFFVILSGKVAIIVTD